MKGNVILEKKPKTAIVYDEASAYVMIDMLKDVVSDGTARRIRIQDGKMPVAGKTGTTSDNKDKWFVGFTPYYTAAVWYGYDRPVTIVPGETSRALDIWQDVMDRVHKGLAIKDFPEPESIVKKSICRYSGKVATELCALDPRGSSVRQEIFIPGTEPSDKCNIHVKASVCKDSLDPLGRNLLSGDYCPFESIIEQVFIQRPNPYVQKEGEKAAPQDSKYDLPTEYCKIHGSSSEAEPTTDDTENPTPSYTPPEDGTISIPEDRTISPMWDFE
jgi:penicillin-binding protein 1A